MTRAWQARLDEFVAELARTLGENLVAVALFGEGVRGDPRNKHAQLDLLVILRDARPESLRPVGRAVAAWVKTGNPPPLIFSERGWRDSTDVFPIEIEDMREAHHVLLGSDPFDGLSTTAADLRQELEREIRGKLLQLRAAFVATEADGRALGELLVASARTFFVLFRGLLRARGQTPPMDPALLIQATAETAKIDLTSFEWALSKLTGNKAPSLEAYDPIGVRYVEAIDQLANFVDGIPNEDDRRDPGVGSASEGSKEGRDDR